MYTFTLFSGSTDENFENPTLTKVGDFDEIDAALAWAHGVEGAAWIRQANKFDKSQVRWCYVNRTRLAASLSTRWRSDMDVRTHFKVVE